MPYGAFKIHGISEEFLSDKPVFLDIVDDFLDYIGKDRFIIHNADFDMKFLSYEMKLINKPQLPIMRAIDTLHMARKTFPGQSVSLDALCKGEWCVA
jgi:DNA polymerase-3 subunit epsilon